jgi:hypothetical protein
VFSFFSLQALRFSQQCCWGFRWHSLTEWEVPSISKTLRTFAVLAAAHWMTEQSQPLFLTVTKIVFPAVCTFTSYNKTLCTALKCTALHFCAFLSHMWWTSDLEVENTEIGFDRRLTLHFQHCTVCFMVAYELSVHNTTQHNTTLQALSVMKIGHFTDLYVWSSSWVRAWM